MKKLIRNVDLRHFTSHTVDANSFISAHQFFREEVDRLAKRKCILKRHCTKYIYDKFN